MAKQLDRMLASANYRHPVRVKQDLQNVCKYFKSLSPRLENYIFPTGVQKELVCLDGTIPVNFKGSVYNIPVGIFISDNHPFLAPLCYVRPTKDMTIKMSRHVDSNGRIYLPYLNEWNETTSDIMGTIQMMQFVFGENCPVYQRAKKDETTVPTNVAMPPSLPSSFNPYATGGVDNNISSSSSTRGGPSPTQPVYPFSSQPQPYSPGQSNDTGTITEEHIRASLLSCVEDKLKSKMKEKIHQIQDEIEVLKKTSNDLNRGKTQLDEMKTRMANDIVELTEAKNKLRDLDEQLQEFIEKYDKEGEDINPDEVYGPTTPLFKQLLDAFAEENAVVDAIFYSSEALRKGVIPLDVYLKNVRELSRRQFMLRALMRACRTKASLPN